MPTAQPFLLSGCSWYQGQKNNSIAWAALGSVQLYSLGFHDSFYCLRLPHPPPRGVGWETGQGMKCLLCKHQGLSSDPWHPDKKLSTVAHICDASTGQGETGIPEAYWPATSAEAVSVRSCVSRWSLTQYHTLVSRRAHICRHMHREHLLQIYHIHRESTCRVQLRLLLDSRKQRSIRPSHSQSMENPDHSVQRSP